MMLAGVARFVGRDSLIQLRGPTSIIGRCAQCHAWASFTGLLAGCRAWEQYRGPCMTRAHPAVRRAIVVHALRDDLGRGAGNDTKTTGVCVCVCVCVRVCVYMCVCVYVCVHA
jgi:hypothetical protein